MPTDLLVLPVELEREIFELTAYAFPECIVQLMLVAQRVRLWLEPELYRVLRLDSEKRIPPVYKDDIRDLATEFSSRVLDLPRLKGFGHHVEHALLQTRYTREIIEVLECCYNVQNLALWVIRDQPQALIPLIGTLPSLRKLSLDPLQFFPDPIHDILPFDLPMFRNITHLDIINADGCWLKWSKLPVIPNLTHLALPSHVHETVIAQCLERCLILQILILLRGHSDRTLISELHDDRLIVLNEDANPLDDWALGVRGGKDFWVTAGEMRQKTLEAKGLGG